MNSFIFDSSALLAYFYGEQGMENVQKVFNKAVQDGVPLLISPVNLGEVYYVTARKNGLDKAEETIKMLDELFVETPPVNLKTALEAAKLKTKYGLGYADSFAAALALEHIGELVTKDKEFKVLEKELAIHWI